MRFVLSFRAVHNARFRPCPTRRSAHKLLKDRGDERIKSSYRSRRRSRCRSWIGSRQRRVISVSVQLQLATFARRCIQHSFFTLTDEVSPGCPGCPACLGLSRLVPACPECPVCPVRSCLTLTLSADVWPARVAGF